MYKGKCKYCGKEIISAYKSTLPMFCSYECSARWKWENVREKQKFVVKKCAMCGKEIRIAESDQRLKENQTIFFCSHECSGLYARFQRKPTICPICGRKYFTRGRTCSDECSKKSAKFYAYRRKKNLPNLDYVEYVEFRKEEEEMMRLKKKQREPFVYSGREKEYLKEYHEKNKERFREYEKKRMSEDALYRKKSQLRKFMCQCFKRRRVPKRKRSEDIYGCSFEYLIKYIENQFQEGMSWDNYGKWQIDHIKPLSLANTEHEVEELCHYTNLQPLWAEDNRKKSNKY